MNLNININSPLIQEFKSILPQRDPIYAHLDYEQIQIITNEKYSLIIVTINSRESQDQRIEMAEQLVNHQRMINQRLRNLGLNGILVDIIKHEIIKQDDQVYIICKTMRLSKQKGQVNLGLANCIEFYTGLELKGVRPQIVMHIEDLGLNKIIPFTFMESILNEDNYEYPAQLEQNGQLDQNANGIHSQNQSAIIIIYNDQLVQFKKLSEMKDIHILKYLELTSGVKISDVLKKSSTSIVNDKIHYLNQEGETFGIGDVGERGNVELNIKIKQQCYVFRAEWNHMKELINQRIDGQSFEQLPNNLFTPIDNAILSHFNHYEFDQRGSLIFLNCSHKGDVKNKVIIINKQIKRQIWFIALKTLLTILQINIQNAIYQDQKLYLRTLCKLNQKIPILQVEIQADLKEEDFNLILDQCNLNPHLESFILDGSAFKDAILSGLIQGNNLKSIKELSFKGCQNITDEGISLLQNFGVQKLDLSFTQIYLSVPQHLQILNISYSRFKEETLLQLLRDKSLVNLISINISGLASDKLIQVIFSCHYKELRVLIANECKLSLSVFHHIHDSKHVKQLDLLSFQGSITDVEESIFKKNGYALLGASKTKINKLDLANCYINDKLIQSMVEAGKLLKNLRVISLSGCRYISDKSIYLLCDAHYTSTSQLKSLDISNLPQITESSLEYLTNKPLKNLSDLNLAYSTQIQAEHLKKAFDTGKFNQLKYLGISGTSESGGQADIFKFSIPELCTYYIRNHLSEIQLVEIYTSTKNIQNISTAVLNLLQTQILTKIVTTDQIILEPETYDLFKSSLGCERLLLNNKPLQLDNQDKSGQLDQLTANQFYEKLLKQHQNVIINNTEIKFIRLMYNFQTIKKICFKKTEILDKDIFGICQNLTLQEINIKSCKKLTFKSLIYLQKLSDTLINIDFRGTIFENLYGTLKQLQYFPQLLYLNGGKLNIEIININQTNHVIQELKHLPSLWMQLEQIKSFKLTIRAHYIQTFKFIFKTLSLLLNKNQDLITQMSLQLYQFKVIQDKSLQLFHNSLLNLRFLKHFHLGFQSMKNISLLTLKNMIISLSSLDSLKSLSISLDDCELQFVDEDLFLASTIFEGIRNMKLQNFSFSSNDTVTYDQSIFSSLFKYMSENDTLNQVCLSFQRHAISRENLSELFQTLKELNLQSLSLNFEQSEVKYTRQIWAELLEVLRMNYSLLHLELNFNHTFELTDMDILNIIDELYCMKLTTSCVSLIGCYHNEKSIKEFTNEDVKNYQFFI
ncbi:unnamed protein product (macronuclear) [Paramecium tetraurelia]|uniref:Uncharacterized protein n=1 Tax=Paramecium tetraurelia TaxID=5888 RepID=A0DQB2_PARTE|nr:uncharacterized protein GSPATT00002629001 [Paramecium tetraurelia]CAK85229.1 unnamed protein product [Paramecium tetraurelia]|eukprot:XP_001452626.1 hypothetical protein (macronuclear) [Paramecium tetraurelia strain d4-2]